MHLCIFSLIALLATFVHADTTKDTKEAAQVIEGAENAARQEVDIKEALRHANQENNEHAKSNSDSMHFSDMSSEWQDQSDMSAFESSFWTEESSEL